MDIIDKAYEREQTRFNAALSNQLAKTQHYQNETGSDDCVECLDPIPRTRKNALPHVTRCIECQEMMERRS